ncbi:tyrosine recombinase XerC [Lysinibacillus sp. PLM2]|nr:tyrosine recombinase XerC [Lysinibacillus sp. PLM2]
MIEEFINEMERQGLSKSTLEGYVFDIAQFFKWLKSEKLDNQITKEVLNEYKIFLTSKYSENTVLRKIKSVIRYNKFLYHIGESSKIIEPNEVIRISKVKGAMKIMELNDLVKIRKIILEGQNKRDILLFHLLLATSCRVSELINLELDDIEIANPSEGSIVLKNLKSAESIVTNRKIAINEVLINIIKDYIEVRPVSETKKLLIGQKGPLTRDAINKLFRKYSMMANIKYTVSPNLIRRMGILYMTKLVESESIKMDEPTTIEHIRKRSDLKVKNEFEYLKTRYMNKWRVNNEQKPN